MDLSTIIGFVAGIFLVVWSMAQGGGGLVIFADLPSLAMVIGGSFAAMMIGSPLSRLSKIGTVVKKVINTQSFSVEKIIGVLVRFSEKARREGLLALEDELEALENEFMKKGIQFVVDGTDPEVIKTMLYTELNQLQSRHGEMITFFGNWSSMGPAYGMIGTLVGLIAMLANLSDSASLGSGMALALITTLYGSLLSNFFLTPIKFKLEDRDAEETLVLEIVIEGILSIQSGDNPRILESKLLSYLAPSKREGIRAEIGSSE
ncbi:MAG: motility protein A [Spirochaetales bacterium]|jgi:chemotaxis protein MotA|nr:motility protein A [Spirochaetales bacterium]